MAGALYLLLATTKNETLIIATPWPEFHIKSHRILNPLTHSLSANILAPVMISLAVNFSAPLTYIIFRQTGQRVVQRDQKHLSK